MKLRRKTSFLTLTLSLLLVFAGLATEGNATGVDYVALGDSLAAGQTPNSEIGASYTDLIALAMKRSGNLASFNKSFAFPGYTTGQVLEQLEKEEVREAVENGNLITISAGANDLLSLIHNDPGRGMLSYESIPAAFALNNVRENYAEILQKLKLINQHAQVYVMGYYFPYPHVFENQKPAVKKQLELLNQILKQEAEKSGAVFVPVAASFGTDADNLVPNPADVHPAASGYLEMANQFLKVFAPASSSIPESVLQSLPPAIPFSKLASVPQPENDDESIEQEQEDEVRQENNETTSAAVKGCNREEVETAVRN